uniref:GH06235p n=1 Tax=Drosophila melanogaster TaxID=7227 RepID=Q8MT99_DROME|nr:GH06235p [Drosophila melanogaster]
MPFFFSKSDLIFKRANNSLLSGLLMFISHHHKIILPLSYFIKILFLTTPQHWSNRILPSATKSFDLARSYRYIDKCFWEEFHIVGETKQADTISKNSITYLEDGQKCCL